MTEAQTMLDLADEIEQSRGLLSMDREPIGGTTQLGIRSTTLVIKALRASTAAAQPVAWRVKNDLGHWFATADEAVAKTWMTVEHLEVQPLYAALPASQPDGRSELKPGEILGLQPNADRDLSERQIPETFQAELRALRGALSRPHHSPTK